MVKVVAYEQHDISKHKGLYLSLMLRAFQFTE